jgi:phage gp36-like protein
MSYITNADIESRLSTALYIQLTDDANTGSADATKATEARLGAEGEANSYLATRYETPVDVSSSPEVSAVLKSFVLDIAIYRLHRRKPPVPPDVVRAYAEAVTWLSRVASAVVQLPATIALTEPTTLGILAENTGPERSMTRETLDQL